MNNSKKGRIKIRSTLMRGSPAGKFDDQCHIPTSQKKYPIRSVIVIF